MKREVPRDEFIRKRMERQRRIRKRRLIIFFIFFIITAICTAITLSLTVFFPIENIEIKGSKIYSSEEILNHCGIEIGDNLFTASQKAAENSLKKSLPYVESVQINRELSGTLNITVKDAKEFACYNIGGRYFTVSESGWVLKENEAPPENLVEIKINDAKCSVGSGISFEDETAKSLIDEIVACLKEEEIVINSVDITDKINIRLYVDNRFEVELGTNENIDRKIMHLSGMIENIPSEKSGKINLSMWTSTNTQGTFTEKKDK